MFVCVGMCVCVCVCGCLCLYLLSVSLNIATLKMPEPIFSKRQKFTPGDIPDNSPGQWQGSPAAAAAAQNPTMPALFSDQCTVAPHTALHVTSFMLWFILCVLV